MKKIIKEIIIILFILETLGLIFWTVVTMNQDEKVLYENHSYSRGFVRSPKSDYTLYKNGLAIRKVNLSLIRFVWIDYIGMVNTSFLNYMSTKISNEDYYQNPRLGDVSDAGNFCTRFYSGIDNNLIILSQGDTLDNIGSFYGKEYYEEQEQKYLEYEQSKKEYEERKNNQNEETGFLFSPFYIGSPIEGSNISSASKTIIYCVKILCYLFYVKLVIVLIAIIKILRNRKNRKNRIKNKAIENKNIDNLMERS